MNIYGKRTRDELPDPLEVGQVDAKKICIKDGTIVKYCLPTTAPPGPDYAMFAPVAGDDLVWDIVPAAGNVLQQEILWEDPGWNSGFYNLDPNTQPFNAEIVRRIPLPAVPVYPSVDYYDTHRSAQPVNLNVATGLKYKVLPTAGIMPGFADVAIGGNNPNPSTKFFHALVPVPYNAAVPSSDNVSQFLLEMELFAPVDGFTSFNIYALRGDRPIVFPVENVLYTVTTGGELPLYSDMLKTPSTGNTGRMQNYRFSLPLRLLDEQDAGGGTAFYWVLEIVQHSTTVLGTWSTKPGAAWSGPTFFITSFSSGAGIVVPVSSISHNDILDIGVNSHAALDTFKGVMEGWVDQDVRTSASPSFANVTSLTGLGKFGGVEVKTRSGKSELKFNPSAGLNTEIKFEEANVSKWVLKGNNTTNTLQWLPSGGGIGMEMFTNGLLAANSLAGASVDAKVAGALAVAPVLATSLALGSATCATTVNADMTVNGSVLSQIVDARVASTLSIGPATATDIVIGTVAADTHVRGELVAGYNAGAPDGSIRMRAQPGELAQVSVVADAGFAPSVLYGNEDVPFRYMSGVDIASNNYEVESGSGNVAISANQAGDVLAPSGLFTVGAAGTGQVYVNGSVAGSSNCTIMSVAGQDAFSYYLNLGSASSYYAGLEGATGDYEIRTGTGNRSFHSNQAGVVTIPIGLDAEGPVHAQAGLYASNAAGIALYPVPSKRFTQTAIATVNTTAVTPLITLAGSVGTTTFALADLAIGCEFKYWATATVTTAAPTGNVTMRLRFGAIVIASWTVAFNTTSAHSSITSAVIQVTNIVGNIVTLSVGGSTCWQPNAGGIQCGVFDQIVATVDFTAPLAFNADLTMAAITGGDTYVQTSSTITL